MCNVLKSTCSFWGNSEHNLGAYVAGAGYDLHLRQHAQDHLRSHHLPVCHAPVRRRRPLPHRRCPGTNKFFKNCSPTPGWWNSRQQYVQWCFLYLTSFLMETEILQLVGIRYLLIHGMDLDWCGSMWWRRWTFWQQCFWEISMQRCGFPIRCCPRRPYKTSTEAQTWATALSLWFQQLLRMRKLGFSGIGCASKCSWLFCIFTPLRTQWDPETWLDINPYNYRRQTVTIKGRTTVRAH